MRDSLISVLRLSGSTLLSYFEKPLEEKRKESQSSIVTEADFASDKIITGYIKDKYPGHNIISEESGFLNNNSEFTWVIDPLDGTSNFASGIPWFGVLISVFKDNIPVLGGAYLPVTDTLYLAEKGKGATRDGLPLKISKKRELSNSLMAFSVDYTEDELFFTRGMEIYKHLVRESRNIRSTNSLIDFIFVAEAKFGGCINLFTRVWDISALGLIISEAGGAMTDIHGEAIEYMIGEEITEKNFPVIAGSREIIESLKKFLK